MKVSEKKKLYESIMMNVSKIVKKKLNEYGDGIEQDVNPDDDITVYVPLIGCECTVIPCYDEETGGTFYEVHDDNDEYVCEIHDDVDTSDEDALVDAIEDNYQWESKSGDYENVDPLGPDDSDVDDEFDTYEEDEDYDV